MSRKLLNQQLGFYRYASGQTNKQTYIQTLSSQYSAPLIPTGGEVKIIFIFNNIHFIQYNTKWYPVREVDICIVFQQHVRDLNVAFLSSQRQSREPILKITQPTVLDNCIYQCCTPKSINIYQMHGKAQTA